MIRDIRRNGEQPKDTMHTAACANLITGMGVIIKDEKTVDYPSSETVSNIYIATKERYPSGLNAARTDMSDYDDDFVKIHKGEYLGLERYTDGEKFATDQFKTTDFEEATAGMAVSVGIDGLWMKSTVDSKYVFEKSMTDNGHKLVVIRVESDTVTHA